MLSQRTGRPVKLVMTRGEVLRDGTDLRLEDSL